MVIIQIVVQEVLVVQVVVHLMEFQRVFLRGGTANTSVTQGYNGEPGGSGGYRSGAGGGAGEAGGTDGEMEGGDGLSSSITGAACY